MIELRQDYLTGEWVSIAPERGNRPITFIAPDVYMENENVRCPFCPENSDLLQEVTYSEGRIRVVPNIYPVLEGQNRLAYGYHEVVIDTPEHNERFHQFSVEDIASLIIALKSRINYFSAVEGIRNVQIFKNDGVKAGASIFHSHHQVLAMPFIPQRPATILNNFITYNEYHESCYLCDRAERIVLKDEYYIHMQDNVIVYAPYASQFGYCVNIMPIEHISDFAGLDGDTIHNLAAALKKSLCALFEIFPDLNYNICFYTPPFVEYGMEHWHFFIQIIPRIGYLAGYEISTRCFINPVDPRIAAKDLRLRIELME